MSTDAPAPPASEGQVLPVFVGKRGFRRWFHPTVVELQDAVNRAVEQARRWRWIKVEKLALFIAARVKGDLRVSIYIEHVADEAAGAKALLEISTDAVGPVYVEMAIAPE